MRANAVLIFIFFMNFLMSSCGSQKIEGKLLSRRSETTTIHDVGSSIAEILEYESIRPACDNYWAMLDENDNAIPNSNPQHLRELEVKCGKWLFLGWETSGKMPLP